MLSHGVRAFKKIRLGECEWQNNRFYYCGKL
jgi:hypothetical protein